MTSIKNRWLSEAPGKTFKGNAQDDSAHPQDLSIEQARSLLGISVVGSFETFTGLSEKIRGRYLRYAATLSNIVGLPIMYESNLEGVIVKCASPSSGWVRIRVNGSNLYSVQMVDQDTKIMTGIIRSLQPGDDVSVFIESSAGMDQPTVRVHIV